MNMKMLVSAHFAKRTQETCFHVDGNFDRLRDIGMTTSGRKIESIQALRGIAFLFIFLAHAKSQFNWSRLGVSIFFCLSGYLLVYTNLQKEYETGFSDCFRFAWYRIKKMYPLHIVTMILALLIPVMMFVIKGSAVIGVKDLILALFLNIGLVQSWYPSMEINIALNGVAWYLSTLAFLYFCFPWILNLLKKIKKEWILWVISIAILFIQLGFSMLVLTLHGSADGFFVWSTYFFPVFRLGDLILGANAAIFYKNHLDGKEGNVLFVSIMEATCLVLVIFYEKWRSNPGTNCNLLQTSLLNWTTVYIPVAVIWILLFSWNQGCISRMMSNPILVWIGDMSPVAFLIHFVVTQYAGNALNFFDVTLVGGMRIALYVVEFLITVILTYLWQSLQKHNDKNKNDTFDKIGPGGRDE